MTKDPAELWAAEANAPKTQMLGLEVPGARFQSHRAAWAEGTLAVFPPSRNSSPSSRQDHRGLQTREAQIPQAQSPSFTPQLGHGNTVSFPNVQTHVHCTVPRA